MMDQAGELLLCFIGVAHLCCIFLFGDKVQYWYADERFATQQ
jgi:hypothetical protein